MKVARFLNTLSIRVLLPCLAFHLVQGLGPLRAEYALPILMPWLVVLGAAAFFGWICRWRGYSRQTWGALVLAAGLGNTSFVGFPLIEFLRGKDALHIAVLADQFGTFLALATGGSVLVAVLGARGEGAGRTRLAGAVRRIALFPPLWATALGLMLRGVALPESLLTLVGGVGRLLAPAALISVVIQVMLILRAGGFAKSREPILFGLAYKLVLAPAAVLLVYRGLLGARGEILDISVLEAAMAPMITGAVMASEEGLDPTLANLLVGAGVPLSLVTVPVWDHLLLGL